MSSNYYYAGLAHGAAQGNLITSANATAGVDIIAAPVAGRKIVIDALRISTDTDMYITLRSKTTGTVFDKVFLVARVPCPILYIMGRSCPDAGEAVQVVASVAGNIAVLVDAYHIVAATS